jgi:predicted regulator of Ras-like GTPase activity (Roadblock/LC7/MglB family)
MPSYSDNITIQQDTILLKNMPLVFEQLIYTSFPKTGFKLLVSQQITPKIEQFFLDNIVYQYWDVYNPPQPEYKAIYLHQIAPQQTLFGWLYNRGQDDLGRSDIPYFVCYYCQELLDSNYLNYIFNCLQKGPFTSIDFKNIPPEHLGSIVITNLWDYKSAAEGVEISLDIQKQNEFLLQKDRLLCLFVAEQQSEKINECTDNKLQYLENIYLPSNIAKTQVNIEQTDAVLQELVSQNQEITGAALISTEAQLLSSAIGIEKNSVLALAGIVLYLSESTCNEFKWQQMTKFLLQNKEGENLQLLACTPSSFLLVKMTCPLSTILEQQLNLTISKLKTELHSSLE